MDLLLLSMHVPEKRNDRGMYPAMGHSVRMHEGEEGEMQLQWQCSCSQEATSMQECMHALCSHSDAKI